MRRKGLSARKSNSRRRRGSEFVAADLPWNRRRRRESSTQGWDRSWTLTRLRESQPDPFSRLIPAQFLNQGGTKVSPPRRKRPVEAPRSFHGDVWSGYAWVDPDTGEMSRRRTDAHTRRVDVDCVEAKQTRRHVILKTGYGGRNGQRKYRKHGSC